MKHFIESSIMSAVTTMLLVVHLETANAQSWYNPNWAYRRAITINNTGSSLTNYQVRVALDATFTWGNARSDGADVRFTAADGTTALPFWIESWTPATSANIWIKVPSIAGSPATTTIYLYYGNSSATSTNSGTATFSFFDDFAGMNPVQTATQSWWEATSSYPMVFEDVSFVGRPRYHMLYDGHGVLSGSHAKGYATSDDLNTWTEYDSGLPHPPSSNPILGPGSYTGGDNFAWGDPIKVGSTYYVFPYKFGSATAVRVGSTDLQNWSDIQPLVETGGGTIGVGVAILKGGDGITPIVIDNKYWMVYFRRESFDALYLAYADVAGDLLHWTRTGTGPILTPTPGTWDAASLGTPCFARFNNKYYIYYGGDPGGALAGLLETGYASGSAFDGSSNPIRPDATTWTKTAEPVIRRSSGQWDYDQVQDPVLRQFNGVYYLFYTGAGCNGYATASSPEGPWTKLGGAGGWIRSGTPTVSGGILRLSNFQAVVSKNTYQYKAMGYRANFPNTAGIGLWGGFVNSPNPPWTMIRVKNNSLFLSNHDGSNETRSDLGASSLGGFHVYELLWKSGTTTAVVDHGAASQSQTNSQVPSVALPVGFHNYDYSGNLQLDWVYVRQYASPEPTATAGFEQVAIGLPETKTCSSTGTGYSFPLSKATLTFGTLPSGGGDVTITRHDGQPPSPTYPNPPAGSSYLQVWFEITSPMTNGSFAATVTVDVSGVSGFGPTSQVTYYSSTTNTWVPIGGTYSSGTFTFTTTHFTPFAFVNPAGSSYNIYLSGSATSVSQNVITPDSSWRTNPPPTSGYHGTDDWSFSGAQQVSTYIVPQAGIQFGACDLTLEWDATMLTLGSVDFGSKATGGSPNGLFGTGHEYTSLAFSNQLGTTNRVRINCSRTDNGNFTTAAGDFIALVKFALLKPGHSTVSIIGGDFRYYNAGSAPSSVYTVPVNADVKAYLADVAAPGGTNSGDGLIDHTDLAPWSISYWSTPTNLTHYKVKYDIGPTQDNYIFSFPVPDQTINFEDLMIFSIYYNLSANHVLPKVPPQGDKPVRVYTGAPRLVGNETYVPVHVSGPIPDIRGMSLVLSGRFGKFVGAEKGTLLSGYTTPVMVMAKSEGSSVLVDLAVMGLDAKGLSGEGEVAVLRFEGDAHGSISKAECRNSLNQVLKVSVAEAAKQLPSTFGLDQNYPNPFNPLTVISYSVPPMAGRDLVSTDGRDGQLPVVSSVKLVVYDMLGQEVATLVDEAKAAGTYQVEWNGTDTRGRQVASGIYFYSVQARPIGGGQAGEFRSIKKMLLLK